MMMFSLYDYVRDDFDGILAFGDVHGDFLSFSRAYEYARSENYFFMSMGDLVDRGPQPFSVVKAMSDAVFDGRGGVVIGNHDEKFRRFHNGAKVKFSKDSQGTLDSVGKDREHEFLKLYTRMLDDDMFSAYFHKFDDITLVHAASHPSIWEGKKEGSTGKTAISRFLFGETNGETHDDGYPVRLYNWIEEVPAGKTVIIGHDKQPIHNVPITEPMIVDNKNGGRVIFLDTGCGKGGFLSGVVLLHDKKKFKIHEFKEFK